MRYNVSLSSARSLLEIQGRSHTRTRATTFKRVNKTFIIRKMAFTHLVQQCVISFMNEDESEFVVELQCYKFVNIIIYYRRLLFR